MNDDKVSILIVDDKPEKLLSLEVVLEELGQKIVRAYSGREALRALLNQDFAVILLDVNMPGMDGFETASLIRQRQSTEHIPIIFITAFGDENHSSRGYQLGAVDYIQTPVLPEVLKTKVAVFVDLYRKTEQVQRQAQWQQRRAAQLQKLAAASLAINSALSIEKMLQTVTDTARELVGSHQAITLLVLEPGSDHQHPPRTQSFASFSEKYAKWRDQRLDLDLIATTVVARSHAASRLTEVELRAHPDWEIVSGVRLPPVHGGMLAAPLVSRAGVNLGVIYLCDRYEGQFTHDDEAILTQLAQMTSIAVENTFYAEERETNRIKDEFLSTLSHELRTPLNAILGWTQLLRLGQLDAETGHAVEVIERNARAQARLVEDLLDVSRVTSNKLQLNTRPMNFSVVAAAAVDGIRPTAEEKQLILDYQRIDGADDRIEGDPDRLQQVVWNLLSNAVKFTPPGGRVEARLDCAGPDSGAVRLRITDSGRGISPAFLPYVFDRFRQADSTSTRSQGGLGIGLTIVRRIVELHGGTVQAESSGEGMGSTFTVQLPTGAASGAAGGARPPAVRHAPGESPAEATDLAQVRVLVVDDESDARDVVAQILRHSGAVVETAACVREALAAISRARPDVIVSDVAMPDQDGYDLVRILREMSDGQTNMIPTLALTAYAREEDRIRCLSAGFQAHVAKPVDPTELCAVVAHLAPQRSASAELKCG
jgi:signal transduction histidine kinase